jgi:hypothetical protein
MHSNVDQESDTDQYDPHVARFLMVWNNHKSDFGDQTCTHDRKLLVQGLAGARLRHIICMFPVQVLSKQRERGDRDKTQNFL